MPTQRRLFLVGATRRPWLDGVTAWRDPRDRRIIVVDMDAVRRRRNPLRPRPTQPAPARPAA